MSRELYQSDESYSRTLRELQKRADAGVPLRYQDSEAVGDKYTVCTLGLCDDGIERKMDGVYPQNHHACPHDGRYFTETGERTAAPLEWAYGCFYKCHIFKGSKASRALAPERIRAVVGKATAIK